MTTVASLDGLLEATQRLVRTVDGLPDEALREPSMLPGWSRGHVVAHLILNAEALTGVLSGIKEGEDVPMYHSQEQRDADIEELQAAAPTDLRERFLASTRGFQDAVVAVPEGGWAGEWRRLASGGEVFERIVRDRAGGPGLLLRTPDGDVPVGSGAGPVVSGSRVDLTWWLLGRGAGAGLTGDPHLPELAAWR